MVFLIVASPCALAAECRSGNFIRNFHLAKQGVLFKGGSFLSNLAEVKALAFDKTGTLTKGKPEVTDYLFVDGLEDRQDELVAVLTNMEKNPIIHWRRRLLIALKQKQRL